MIKKNMDKGLTVPKWVLIVFFPLVPALKMEQAYDPGELCKYNHDCQEYHPSGGRERVSF